MVAPSSSPSCLSTLQRSTLEVVLPATITHNGQVAGPVRRRGLWNSTEWLPSLVLSSLHLDQVPNSLGSRFDNIDFVPADLLTDALVAAENPAFKLLDFWESL
ncbi:hypothetical protein F4820DRAFT_451100 [Hypoxylon rubiginosum]|uniref:Uncharacterized protein n=1 Tax=Hypoxylon rubiginosum TaxID=110542 RepID=A0ACB9YS93_9PEZI|nr:hypothetical protein F4820DRAFT_451100 [Hypoxylon rubiginosum]